MICIDSIRIRSVISSHADRILGAYGAGIPKPVQAYQRHLVVRVIDGLWPKVRRCMIAGANVRSMRGLKCTFMGFSFATADTFRLSLNENRTLLPQTLSKRGVPGPWRLHP